MPLGKKCEAANSYADERGGAILFMDHHPIPTAEKEGQTGEG